MFILLLNIDLHETCDSTFYLVKIALKSCCTISHLVFHSFLNLNCYLTNMLRIVKAIVKNLVFMQNEINSFFSLSIYILHSLILLSRKSYFFINIQLS